MLFSLIPLLLPCKELPKTLNQASPKRHWGGVGVRIVLLLALLCTCLPPCAISSLLPHWHFCQLPCLELWMCLLSIVRYLLASSVYFLEKEGGGGDGLCFNQLVDCTRSLEEKKVSLKLICFSTVAFLSHRFQPCVNWCFVPGNPTFPSPSVSCGYR